MEKQQSAVIQVAVLLKLNEGPAYSCLKTPVPGKVSEPAKISNAENRFFVSASSAPSSNTENSYSSSFFVNW